MKHVHVILPFIFCFVFFLLALVVIIVDFAGEIQMYSCRGIAMIRSNVYHVLSWPLKYFSLQGHNVCLN